MALAFGLGMAVTFAVIRPGPPGRSLTLVHDTSVLFQAPDASMATGVRPVDAAAGTAAALPDVDTMIASVEERLVRDPSDADGWMMLGWSYANTGRTREAVPAYARAAQLRPDDPEVLGQYGAALVALAGGQVDGEATAVFDRVLALSPEDPRGLYYAGLARVQDGDEAAGTALLRRALAAAPSDAPWLADLRARLAMSAP
jgi:cytochrome c-type biogenesis protein CcmH